MTVLAAPGAAATRSILVPSQGRSIRRRPIRRAGARRLPLIVATVSVVVAGGLVPAGAAAAEVIEPVCPQASAFRGIEIVPTAALSVPDPHAETSISSGALPAGVTLVDGVFSGVPTATGISSFTLEARFTDAPMKTVACTVGVDPAPTPSRITGSDRYDQAVKVTRSAFPTGGIDVLYLASGEKFSDALSAGSVAGVHGAPLLLTQSGTLPAVTKAEITRLAPKDIVVVGGTASVSAAVFGGLKSAFAAANVHRVAGADRFDVSRSLISHPTFGVPSSAWVYLATGVDFPDALAASPAAVSVNGPVMLVDGSQPTVSAADLALLTSLKATSVRIAGGRASVTDGIQRQLAVSGYAVTRAEGADRYQAAVSVNREAFLSATTVYLASGTAFADALSAAPIAGKNSAPIYLVPSTCVPASVLQEIVRVHPKNIVVLGGYSTLNADIDALKPC
ncbi:cell wall-binding repeat-containing protein [Herbiconiux liukaitaii]|uniref:cell wall-binding repeat-containing protein n=1 Tax=Herbiconiux liukaitaii TaxID=3342799 RepID=UPI0035B894B2